MPKKTLPKLSKDGSVHVTDEFYNTLISSIGAFLVLVGVGYLIYQSGQQGKFWHLMGFVVYGLGALGVFVTSALHHGIDSTPRVEHILRQLDYFAIPVMIAGTVTPFCLIFFQDSFGWQALAVIWILAVMGIGIKGFFPHAPKWIMVSFFLGMAFSVFGIIEPIYQKIHWDGLLWLIYGGLFFVMGSGIYFFEKPNPIPGRFGFHEIWHIFVVCGASCHYMVMLCFLLPY